MHAQWHVLCSAVLRVFGTVCYYCILSAYIYTSSSIFFLPYWPCLFTGIILDFNIWLVILCFWGYNIWLVLLCMHWYTCLWRYVDRSRRLLDNTFTTLIGESYKRAYSSMVMVQQLAELEEIVQVKQWVQSFASICTRYLIRVDWYCQHGTSVCSIYLW